MERSVSTNFSDRNVTPFVDVCLVLLIIFMIVTPIALQGFDVDVPPKAKNDSPKLPNQLVITVTSEGTISLNKEEIGKGLLYSRVKALFARRGGQRQIFFNAEDGVHYGDAVEIMDILRQAGTETIGIVPETIY